MSYGAIFAATSAAAAEKRRRISLANEEEEKMIRYTPDNLDSDWEFKIVRASTPIFRKRGVLDRLLEEETRAGWVMLEKLDDYRIRLKRPHRARAQDAYLPGDVDPYRSHYGAAPTRYTMAAFLAAGVLLALTLGILMFLLASR